jgi:hypothetical protein
MEELRSDTASPNDARVYDTDRLRMAYFARKRNAAAGIDGGTWRHYGEALEENLRDVAARLTRGASASRGSGSRCIPTERA